MMKMNIVGLIMMLFINTLAFGQTDIQKELQNKISTSFEYYSPLHSHRDIETLTLNFLYGWERYKKTPFTFMFGITGTYAWGAITQLDKNFNDIVFQNNAAGFGPVFLLKFEPFIHKGISIAPEFIGSIILYTEKFPAGGDIYNFMWRMGGSINYRIPKSKLTFSFSCRWMHVSNGQGVSSKNPSYEGIGYGLKLIRYL